ncbi:glycosyltransferase family 9 protein [Desulfobaculum bizertense]|uniref:glycosyltransferase family 9 protein n=1 Tax=Desulfobaculum bizertense TaxID=376490 RepID=UPI001F356709|nr:glycosyltransferase family 9 protein [Desulfobaculum bizertense]UIJ38093.1 glycosyltransferase family 9 protein [Desulfobaculum bizertense]
MTRIGIWNTAFLGDAILTLPLIHSLSAAYPDAELHFFVRKGVDQLFVAQPELCTVRGFAKRGAQKGFSGAYSYGQKLAKERFDLWISPHTSFRSGLISRWTSAGKRIGYSKPWFNNWFYTHTVDRAFDQFDEIERLLRLLGPLQIPVTTKPHLVLPEEAHITAAETFAIRNAPLLGIHPGSTWPTKQWPLEYFSKIVRKAINQGVKVVLFAGPGEEPLAAKVLEGAQLSPQQQDGVLNLAGQLSMTELAAHIAALDCYLSGDSGPMHLAWVQETPLVAIFGPTVRKLGFFPRGKNSTVLEHTLPCRPCSLHGPKECPEGHHDCMRKITPEHVWASIAQKLEQRNV